MLPPRMQRAYANGRAICAHPCARSYMHVTRTRPNTDVPRLCVRLFTRVCARRLPLQRARAHPRTHTGKHVASFERVLERTCTCTYVRTCRRECRWMQPEYGRFCSEASPCLHAYRMHPMHGDSRPDYDNQKTLSSGSMKSSVSCFLPMDRRRKIPEHLSRLRRKDGTLDVRRMLLGAEGSFLEVDGQIPEHFFDYTGTEKSKLRHWNHGG